MIATHETLWLDAPGTGADALSPGAIQRVLCAGLRLSSDAIGLMSPVRRGRVAVEVALPQALNLATPLRLSVQDGESRSLFILRRESDPPEEAVAQLHVSWKGRVPPSPGQLVAALTQASDDRFDTGDLGAVFEGQGWLSAAISEGLLARLSLPSTVKVKGLSLTLAAYPGDAP